MSLSAKLAELEATIEAILADQSGWPRGHWDPTLKMLAARRAVLIMTDNELHDLSERYMTKYRWGVTTKELMAEVARRSRLTMHERMAEAAARLRLQESC